MKIILTVLRNNVVDSIFTLLFLLEFVARQNKVWKIRDGGGSLCTTTVQFSVICCCSVAKSCQTLPPHGLQHARLSCPSLSPGVCSDSCPLSQCSHLTISSSVTSFSSCPQSFLAMTRSCWHDLRFSWTLSHSGGFTRNMPGLLSQPLFLNLGFVAT